MIEIKAPRKVKIHSDDVQLFIAGSIEMGSAENWQTRLTDDLRHVQQLTIWNPRRDDWDSSWVQDPTPGTQFHEQVTWELKHLQQADIVAFYFDSQTKSPITLMELGLAVGQKKRAIVKCDPEFYRYGNVAITAGLTAAPIYHDYDGFRDAVLQMIVEEKVQRQKIRDWQERQESWARSVS